MHLYVHVPFCARRCSYCDFSIAVRPEVPTAEFVDAIAAEWAGWRGHPAWLDSPTVDTIYFGGGTPSRLPPAGIARIIEMVRAERAVDPGAEVTLEANPDDVTEARADAWRRAGITRVSLGSQTFDPGVLAWMHRTHSREQIGTAVAALRGAGIEDLSLDLIFGVPDALTRDWRADVEQALALDPTHLSLYGLTIEQGTPLARWTARGDATPVDERRYADEFLEAHRLLGAAGYDHYEVSNYARPGRRARHNSAYWLRRPFIGLGPSAHSGFGAERRWNLRAWAAYQRAAARGGPVVDASELLDRSAIRLEQLYLGLRTTDGAPTADVGLAASRWVADGWATILDGRVRLTPEGWLRLDALVAALA